MPSVRSNETGEGERSLVPKTLNHCTVSPCLEPPFCRRWKETQKTYFKEKSAKNINGKSRNPLLLVKKTQRTAFSKGSWVLHRITTVSYSTTGRIAKGPCLIQCWLYNFICCSLLTCIEDFSTVWKIAHLLTQSPCWKRLCISHRNSEQVSCIYCSTKGTLEGLDKNCH